MFVHRTDAFTGSVTVTAEGLPAAGGAGYELLDNLSGFGTTSQMFDAAYWRAKEGELARTLLALPEVKAARVHIASVPTRSFQAETTASASVTLTTVSGSLSESQAQAIRHGLARALVTRDEGYKGQLRSLGFLTRDPRAVERLHHRLELPDLGSQLVSRAVVHGGREEREAVVAPIVALPFFQEV